MAHVTKIMDSLSYSNSGKVVDDKAIDSKFSNLVPDACSILYKKGSSETNRITQQCNNTQEEFCISDNCHPKVTLKTITKQSLRSHSKLIVSNRWKAILNRKDVNNSIAHEGQHTNCPSSENSGLGKSDECQGADRTWRSYEKSLNGRQESKFYVSLRKIVIIYLIHIEFVMEKSLII